MTLLTSLTGNVGLKVGPVLLETLVRHYFDRASRDPASGKTVQLMHDELLYDEAFNIVKAFLEASSKHTVEELQGFSNARTPSPPWVHVVRVVIPMACCDEGAEHLIRALGGADVCKRVVGGTKWWQVRGIKGIDAEWITAKKDWQEAKKKYKTQRASGSLDENGRPPAASTSAQAETDPEAYRPDMDEMRCILYSHGGGYYFGSVDQERYAIQRFARKINGRVFAVNYRLAPQYPFPCAIQDLVAAYVYLIRPPKGALHRPVKPGHIVFAGDSAGGGLTFALLQAVRDSGLPAPAGGVLISPWCDMTHSFPSIHTNTATDVIPKYGLAMHKPSTLWPPPSDELTSTVQSRLRSRIRQLARLDPSGGGSSTPDLRSTLRLPSKSSTLHIRKAAFLPDKAGDVPLPKDGEPVVYGATTPVPAPSIADEEDGPPQQRISLVTDAGETLTIDDQIQLYTPNSLLTHPYVSAATAYLGGLPPLLVIASDKEVLRDEGIYAAHRAAHPERYPIREEQRKMYPAFEGIEERYGPTKVHLQVYDDAAHVLPILFSFTTPAKFCYRSVAVFCKHVTGMPQTPIQRATPKRRSTFSSQIPSLPSWTYDRTRQGTSVLDEKSGNVQRKFSLREMSRRHSTTAVPSQTLDGTQIVAEPESIPGEPANGAAPERPPRAPVPRRSFSESVTSVVRKVSRTGTRKPPPPALSTIPDYQTPTEEMEDQDDNRVLASAIVETPAEKSGVEQAVPERNEKSQPSGSNDVAGLRNDPPTPPLPPGARTAGEASAYDGSPWVDNMIRERVSTAGVLQALEPEAELGALTLAPELVCVVSELGARRYIEGRAKFDRKFKHTALHIAKQRRKNLERARRDAPTALPHLQTWLCDDDGPHGHAEGHNGAGPSVQMGKKGPQASWGWAWALDKDERPPSSSIVARRDTEEARRLARIADQHVGEDGRPMSGNNLWGLVMTFLTFGPEGKKAKKTQSSSKFRHFFKHDDLRPTENAAPAR